MLDYDPETGVFRWKQTRGPARKGDIAGSKNVYGYIDLTRRKWLAHRLAWLYMYGECPPEQIDHINGVRDDNRIANLRLATNAQNSRNRLRRKSKSGIKGVSWIPKCRKWKAGICFNGRPIHIGHFATAEEAEQAYRDAAYKLHGEFASF